VHRILPFAVLLAAVLVVAAACSDDGSDPATTTQPPATTQPTVAEPTTRDPETAPPTTVTTTTAPLTVPPTTAPMTPAPTTTGDSPSNPATASEDTVTITVDGADRRYNLFVPGGLPAGPAALVVDMHGALSTPEDHDSLSGMQDKAASAGFVVAQPAGLFRSWEIITGNGNDVDFIRAVVADVQDRTAIDPDRIYAVGMSNGGGMAERLGCVASDLFAAVAGVAGWYVDAVECDTRPVPLVAFHGTMDLVVPYDGTGPLFTPIQAWAGRWAARNGCGPDPDVDRATVDVTAQTWQGCDADTMLYTVEGGNHGWPGTDDPLGSLVTTDTINATDLIWEFFTTHPKG
jgi:polyhydroxybutyrate depolymerase